MLSVRYFSNNHLVPFFSWFKYIRTMTLLSDTAGPDLEHPQEQEMQLTQVLFALSDPGRLDIVRQLRDGPVEMAHCNLMDPEVAKSTKSHLFKVLREAGVIKNTAKGRGRLLALRKDALDRRFPGLLDAVLSAK